MPGRFGTAAAVIVTAIAAWCGNDAKAQARGRTVWDGVYSAAQADRGKGTYAGACASCHGKDLGGGGIFGSRTRTASALRGEAFLHKWEGHTLSEFFINVSTSMPLEHPGSLNDEANTEIVAFILQTNECPAGANDLPADPGAMKTIQISARKK